jgi:ABC-type sulfate/molybdate transport systems ATPase subunit
MKLSVSIFKELPGFTLDVCFETDGGTLGILGSSGSGKSMTLRCITGIDTPDMGRIVLDGRALFDSGRGINLPIRERKVGMLFQNYALFPHLTVEDNIEFGQAGHPEAVRSQKIDAMISMMRLEGLTKRYPRELSGGQQQRVALARALAVEPDALLLDEPFSALDDHLRTLMIRDFTESMNQFRGAMILVTHNIDEAYRTCKNLLVLSDGKMKGMGETRELFANPPTFEAARVTGCKNISRAKKISERELESSDWGCRLVFHDTLPATLSFICISANYLDMSSSESDENIIVCRVIDTSESPFRIQIFLSPVSAPKDSESSIMQWDVSNEKWAQIKEVPQPWRIFVRPELMSVIG